METAGPGMEKDLDWVLRGSQTQRLIISLYSVLRPFSSRLEGLRSAMRSWSSKAYRTERSGGDVTELRGCRSFLAGY